MVLTLALSIGPILLGCNNEDSKEDPSVPLDDEKGPTPKHQDEHQVSLDVDRANLR